MTAELGPEVRALLGARNMAHIGTLMPDGAPQVTPVWITLEGDRLALFTGERSVKARNLRRDARIAISRTSARSRASRGVTVIRV